MANVWRSKYGSIGFGYESTFGVVASSFQYLPAEVDLPDLGRNEADVAQYVAQFGGNAAPVINSKDSGSTLTLRIPLEGFKPGHNPATENPGDAGVLGSAPVLVAMALGSNASAASNHANLIAGAHLESSAYDATDVASAISSAITTSAGSYTPGALVVAGLTSSDFQVGWISTIAGAVLTLFKSAANTAAGSDNTYGTGTAWLSDAEQIPISLRFSGEHAAYSIDFLGCMCSAGSISLSAGAVPMLELTYTFTGHSYNGASGTLQTPAKFNRIPFLGGSNEGRLLIDTTSTHVHDLQLNWEIPLHKVDSHSGPEGTSTRLVTDRLVSVTFAQRWKPSGAEDTIASGSHLWETRYEAGTAVDLQLECGDTLGRIFSMRCPDWIVSTQPKLEEVDGVLYHRITMHPSTFTDDTGSTAPADSLLSLGWG